jgi:uncharacterized protein (TIGR02611 family)
MMARIRERKEKHKQRGRFYRVSFGVAGGLLIATGLLLSLPGVPGPGLVLVAVGLGMLALEFDRAERLLDRTLEQIERAADTHPAVRALGLAVFALVAVGSVVAIVLWDIPFIPWES